MPNTRPFNPNVADVPDSITHRVVGRYNRHGMLVWYVHLVNADGSTGKLVGPPEGHIIQADAIQLASDLAEGRHRVFIGGYVFKPHAL